MFIKPPSMFIKVPVLPCPGLISSPTHTHTLTRGHTDILTERASKTHTQMLMHTMLTFSHTYTHTAHIHACACTRMNNTYNTDTCIAHITSHTQTHVHRHTHTHVVLTYECITLLTHACTNMCIIQRHTLHGGM